MKNLLFLLLAGVCWVPSVGRCGAVLDANVFYFTDTFPYDEDTSTFKRTFWDFFVGMGLNKRNQYVLGWNYGSMTFDDDPGTPSKLTVTDMGPKFIAYLDKDRAWVFGLTYNLITKGKYSENGGAAVDLRGSSMKVEVGYTPPISETLAFGVKLNYYKASFNEKVVDDSITKKANSRTTIYPTLSLTARWD